MGNDGARTDDCAMPNGDVFREETVAADPNIVAKSDHTGFLAIWALAITG